MKKLNKIFSFIKNLLILGVFLYGVYELVKLSIDIFKSLDKEVAAAIIGAMATVFVGLTAVIMNQNSARERAIEESHRKDKIDTYNDFLTVLSRLLANDNDNVNLKKISEKELINFTVKLNKEIMLHGSSEVVKKLIASRNMSENSTHLESLNSMNDLLKAIRADIGLSNKGLKYELVQMYLKEPVDIEILKEEKKSK